MRVEDPWTFYVISVRDPRTDFRCDLVTSLRQLGYQATYVRLGRKCFVDDGSQHGSAFQSPLQLLSHLIQANRRGTRLCVIHSINTGFPVFSLLMRLSARKAVWLFDEHDDLLYSTTGFKRLFERLKLGYFRVLATRSICVSPALCRRVARSLLIPNASSVQRYQRESLDASRVLILSNVDERFDFEIVDELLNHSPDSKVFLCGGKPTKSKIQDDFSKICDRKNFYYRGEYESKNIPFILRNFDLMLVNYKLDSSTHFIDPLRYYHALNGGIEVISS